MRPSLVLYASDLLLAPQRELGRRYGTSTAVAMPAAGAPEAPGAEPEAAGEDMDVDCDARERDEGDGEEDEHEACAAAAAAPMLEGAAVPEATKVAVPGAVDEGGFDSATRNAKALDELREFVQGDFFADLRRRVLQYLDEIQAQQQRELPGELGTDAALLLAAAAEQEGASDSSGDEGTELAAEAREDRKIERLRRYLNQKWSFPEAPGRRAAPGTVEIEFMGALIRIFQLEEWLSDEVPALRDRMCQKLRVSAFGTAGLASESPCFPLILRDVACPWCCVASHVDVTSHPSRGPGLWVCLDCERLYDKDAMEALLVGMLENVVQAWQSQEITCLKCRSLRTAHLQTFCDCFGRFGTRFRASDFRMVLQVMRSLIVPHDLPWLGEMVSAYESMVA